MEEYQHFWNESKKSWSPPLIKEGQGFFPGQWVSGTNNTPLKDNRGHSLEESSNNSNTKHSTFRPEELVTPGWKGESLQSKEAIRVKKIIGELWKDAESKLCSLKEINPSLKQSLFNHFISFAHNHDLTGFDINGPLQFWSHFINPHSPYKNEISSFIKIHSFRSVALYIYKLRFLIKLYPRLNLEIEDKIVTAPNAVFSSHFPKGSSLEIASSSFKVNEYSWYAPSSELSKKTLKELKFIGKISLHEIMKLCTYRPSKQILDKKQMYQESDFSHSLSHQSFGIFLKTLLGHFPEWFNSDNKNKNQIHPFYKDISHYVKNCKFAGDYLTSFCQSHWLGEKFDINEDGTNHFDHIIFPDFVGHGFNEGEFTKLVQEIQFLSFLVDKYQNLKQNSFKNPEICSSLKLEKGLISFLASVFNQKNQLPRPEGEEQFSLFPGLKQNFLFDYIILNITKLPKNNQHHHLVGQLNNQINELKENGILFLFTAQQFFVPSKSDKIDQLLKEFKVEAIFDFEELKGKGELSPYLYILSKRKKAKINFERQFYNDFNSTENKINNNKESCLSFKWAGTLHSFQIFNHVANELKDFLKNKTYLTPLYQNESNNIQFSFHQDAIIDGKLLHSANSANQVTHPLFFKNLTKNCLSFDYFFNFELIDPSFEHGPSLTENFIGLIHQGLKIEDLFPYILIIGHENIHHIEIEIIPSSSYKAKLNQLGHAYHQYFGIKPKIPNLNINIFREYFNTDIGKQIAELSLNGGPTKTKGKLKGLMIPTFFAQKNHPELAANELTSFLYYRPAQILEKHPDEFIQGIKRLQNTSSATNYENLCNLTGGLCQFKLSLLETIDHLLENHEFSNFNNPLFIEKLKNVKTYDFFPENQDIHIKFLMESKLELHLEINSIQKKSNDFNHYLELLHNEKVLCQIYSDEQMILFIKFLLTFTKQSNLKFILQTLKIPRAQDLLQILSEKKELKAKLELLKSMANQYISQIIIQQISAP